MVWRWGRHRVLPWGTPEELAGREPLAGGIAWDSGRLRYCCFREATDCPRVAKAVPGRVPGSDECPHASPDLCCLASVQTGSELLMKPNRIAGFPPPPRVDTTLSHAFLCRHIYIRTYKCKAKLKALTRCGSCFLL